MGLLARPYLQRITALFGDDVDWERHPYNVPAVRDLSSLDFHPDVTFFIGENGAGKSTLLEAIALALGFSIDGGSRNVSNLNTAQETAPLFQSLRLSKSFKTPRDRYFFRAESFHNVATRMDEYNERSASRADSLHARSHGEAFMSVLLDTFRGHGLYLLDEPEAALSPNRQMCGAARDSSTGAAGFAVHHRHALAHFAGLSQREDHAVRRHRHHRSGVRRYRALRHHA